MNNGDFVIQNLSSLPVTVCMETGMFTSSSAQVSVKFYRPMAASS